MRSRCAVCATVLLMASRGGVSSFLFFRSGPRLRQIIIRWRQPHIPPSARLVRLLGTSTGSSSSTPSSSSAASGLYLPNHPSSQSSQPIQNVAAPMVAQSDYAFRCLCRQYGVNLAFTQMLHARNLLQDKTFARNHLDLYEYDKENSNNEKLVQAQQHFLQGTQLVEVSPDKEPFTKGPLVVQLAGQDIQLVVSAAQSIVHQTKGRVDGIDLNLGCPQGIARKGNYGAFLMERDCKLVYDILTCLRKSLPQSVAVSAKIRLPRDDILLRDRIPRLMDTGIDFMTIHGRTLEENKTTVRACHLDRIRLAVHLAKQHKPGFQVIANGGVETFSDIARIRRATGAVAVMSSEALLECPNIFSVDAPNYTPRQMLERQFQFARDYLSWCHAFPPLPGVLGPEGGSFNIVRGHLFKFLHRYVQEHPDVRDTLASQNLRTLMQAESLLNELYERFAVLSDDELSSRRSANDANASWYRRHWNASTSYQRVHQPRPNGRIIIDGANDEAKFRVNVNNNFGEPTATSSTLSIEQQKNAIKRRIEDLKKQRLRKVKVQ